MSKDKLICPYCGKEQLTHEPDTIPSDMCSAFCESCGKFFWYSVMTESRCISYTNSEMFKKYFNLQLDT